MNVAKGERRATGGNRGVEGGCQPPFALRLSPFATQDGFTLLELLIVITIIGILAAIAVPALRSSPQRAREATLKEDLFSMRSVLDQYHGDKGSYPPDLQTLVTGGYLRKIPIDPITKSADTWVLAMEEPAPDQPTDQPADQSAGPPGIIDVHSGSNDKALDGTLYKEW